MNRSLKHLLCAFAVAGTLAACAFTPTPGAPTLVPPTLTPQPLSTPVPPVELTPAQLAALARLSESTGVPFENIAIVSTEAVDWPDSCLGVIHVGFGCADAITPGFRIVLEAHGLRYEYHTDATGQAVTAATLALVWHREGGIAGFCDDLHVYLSGEVYGSSCRNGDGYPLAYLSPDELKQLTEWVQSFGPAAIELRDPAVADAMTLRLSLSGRGLAQPTEADQTALMSWAQSIYDKVTPCC